VNVHTFVGTFLDELLARNGPEREGIAAADRGWTPSGDPDTDLAVLVNELDFGDIEAARAAARRFAPRGWGFGGTRQRSPVAVRVSSTTSRL